MSRDRDPRLPMPPASGSGGPATSGSRDLGRVKGEMADIFAGLPPPPGRFQRARPGLPAWWMWGLAAAAILLVAVLIPGHRWHTPFPRPARTIAPGPAPANIPPAPASPPPEELAPEPDMEARFGRQPLPAPPAPPAAPERPPAALERRPKAAPVHAPVGNVRPHATRAPLPPSTAPMETVVVQAKPADRAAARPASECPAGYLAWCLRDKTMAADRGLRDAYRAAAQAGVDGGRLRAIRHDWIRYRRLANKQPEELIRGYDALAVRLHDLPAGGKRR